MDKRLQLVLGPLLLSIGLTGLLRSLMVDASVIMLLYFALMVAGTVILRNAVLKQEI